MLPFVRAFYLQCLLFVYSVKTIKVQLCILFLGQNDRNLVGF